MKSISQKKVAIIGSGPAGMSQMVAFAQAKMKGEEIPQITCFEKQEKPGGLWNYSWRTGLDQYGEACHSSMYAQLFSNAPKEVLEYPDYTFMDHFNKPVGSFPPRDALHNYILSRFYKYDCLDWIKTSTAVKGVTFDDESSKFTVNYKAMDT
jgi:trimethylamine monooxygenase